MDCPVCASTRLLISERQGIEIDYCPQCRGVWLDRGELDKLIERAPPAASQAQPRQAPPQQAYDQRYGHDYRRKKKGLFGEIFDFD